MCVSTTCLYSWGHLEATALREEVSGGKGGRERGWGCHQVTQRFEHLVKGGGRGGGEEKRELNQVYSKLLDLVLVAHMCGMLWLELRQQKRGEVQGDSE